MDSKRRYIFNGSAAAYGGRFVRPEDVVLASNGGSALSMAGGRSVWSDTNVRLGKAFRLSSAFTSAEGLYDNRDHAIEVTYGKRKAETLTATTIVRAEVRDLAVGGAPPLKPSDPQEPELRVARVGAAMTSRSQAPGSEASITLDDAVLEGITIDGHVLVVELDRETFRKHDTHSKAAKALSSRTADGTLTGTFVKEMRWEGEPFKGATFEDRNIVKVPNFGRIHFGEMYIKQHSRRLAMIRLALGSPTGGDGVCVDVDTNGSWSE